MFITCTDGPFSPASLTGLAPDRLFEIRNMGHIIPKSGPNVISSEVAAIQYVLDDPNLRDVIVCGHSKCTAVACLLNRHTTAVPPSVKRWLSIARSRTACENVIGKIPSGPLSSSAWDQAARAHLAVQVEHLLEYPALARRRASGELRLRAWFYNEGGRVETLPTQFPRLTSTA